MEHKILIEAIDRLPPPFRVARVADQWQQTVDEWRPIETAPKDGIEILLMTYKPVIGFWLDWWRDTANPDFECGPTHWMPLPEPPST